MEKWNLRTKIFMAAAVALCAALPFLQTLGYGFLERWDDSVLFTEEARLSFTPENILFWLRGDYYGQIFFAPFLTFMLDHAAAGLNATLFHAHSLLWHMVASVGVFMCFTLFRVKPWLALLFAIAWAVHPQKAESAAWILERRDLMFGAFWAWSFYFYAKAGKERRFVPLSLGLFALSLLSKPTAVAFPALLCAFELSRLKMADAKDAVFRLAPFFALSLALFLYSFLRFSLVGEGEPSLAHKALSIFHNYPWYLQSFLAPFELLPLYPKVEGEALELLPSAAIWIAGFAVMGALWLRDREFLLRRFVPLWLAFGFSLLPTIGLFKYSGFEYADRYNYMPSALLCFAGAWLFSRLFERMEEGPEKGDAARKRRIVAWLLAAWVAALALAAFSYVKTFSSCIALLERANLPEKPNMNAPGLLALARFNARQPAADELLLKLESSGEIERMKKSGGPFYNSIFDTYGFVKAAEEIRRDPASAKVYLPALEALADSKQSARSILTKPLLLQTLMECQLAARQEAGAVRTLEKLAALADSGKAKSLNHADALFYSGLKEFLQKDYAGAAKLFSEALALKPGSGSIEENLKRSLELRDSASNPKEPLRAPEK